jgi:hypothetical protein
MEKDLDAMVSQLRKDGDTEVKDRIEIDTYRSGDVMRIRISITDLTPEQLESIYTAIEHELTVYT